MFCEQDEDIAVWRKVCDTYPWGDPYVLDLFVWCFLHKPEEYKQLIENHKNHSQSVNMVDIMSDAQMKQLLTPEKKE
jgi:hypothetical protein